MNSGNQSCVITGAGRGIGRALSLRLTAAGMNVLAVSRTETELDETSALCSKHPGRCITHVADITDATEVDRLIARCRSDFGRLDVLVNNAGVAPLSPVDKMSDADFRQLTAVNMEAVFRLCRGAWPLLKESRGTIINISSVASVDPFPGFAAYGASKAWVNVFSQALAAEGKPFGIRVFSVAPGAVETRMLRGAFPDLPVDETLQPDDVAAMIELLLDERCRHSSGQTVFVRR